MSVLHFLAHSVIPFLLLCSSVLGMGYCKQGALSMRGVIRLFSFFFLSGFLGLISIYLCCRSFIYTLCFTFQSWVRQGSSFLKEDGGRGCWLSCRISRPIYHVNRVVGRHVDVKIIFTRVLLRLMSIHKRIIRWECRPRRRRRGQGRRTAEEARVLEVEKMPMVLALETTEAARETDGQRQAYGVE